MHDLIIPILAMPIELHKNYMLMWTCDEASSPVDVTSDVIEIDFQE